MNGPSAYPQYPAQQPQQSSPYGGGYQPYPPVGAGGPGYPPPAQVQPPAYPPSSTQGKECHYLKFRKSQKQVTLFLFLPKTQRKSYPDSALETM